MKKRILSIFAAALTLTACTSCSASFRSAKQLTTTQKAPSVSASDSQQQDAAQAYLNFTASLLQHTFSGDNLLLSPLSAADALCLTMEGATGETPTADGNSSGSRAETMGGYFSTIRRESGEQTDDGGFCLDTERPVAVRQRYLSGNCGRRLSSGSLLCTV